MAIDSDLHKQNCPRAMFIDFFVAKLKNVDVDELLFQQDGATCHTTNKVINLLQEAFAEHIKSHRESVAWPLTTCVFNTAEPFLVGLCEVADKLDTFKALEEKRPNRFKK